MEHKKDRKGYQIGMMKHFVFPAHIRQDGSVQSVAEHCRGTAAIAKESLEQAGLGDTAYLAGLLHDMGKCKREFADYIQKATQGEQVKPGSVNHTFSGVRFILERYHHTQQNTDDYFSNLAAEALAYAIGAHHGLFDCIDPDEQNGFSHRLEKKGISYDESRRGFLDSCASEAEIDQLFGSAVLECQHFLTQMTVLKPDRFEGSFLIGLFARLLLSSVIEGDRADTASFMNGNAAAKLSFQTDESLWAKHLAKMEEMLDALPGKESEIGRARRFISDQCKKAAASESGLFSLNVPTGGGKTLSSLRFALAHAMRHRKKRIIICTPLLSILDQNARVIRKYIGDDAIILEHHSNVVQDTDADEWTEQEIYKEGWNYPVIITTTVAFLNTLFCSSTKDVRRFSALTESVIILDEVQTVPTKMLTMFHLALTFLTKLCGATVVLSSATQPGLQFLPSHPLKQKIREIVPADPAIWKVFERTEIRLLENTQLADVGAKVVQIAEEADSVLVICNKKTEAEHIYDDCLSLLSDAASVFYLSAALCPKHRLERIAEIQAALDRGEKTVCVSTQVIEAGVDISFQSVIRLAAGMENIVQSAGRCNRNGESVQALPVYVLPCTDEDLGHLQDIQHRKSASTALFAEYKQKPDEYEYHLDSNESIDFYYNRLYNDEYGQNHFDYVDGRTTLFSLLSTNDGYITDSNMHDFSMFQAFKTAGDRFAVFDDKSIDVLVPYGDGKDLITDLCSDRTKFDLAFTQKLLRQASAYSVSLYGYQIKKLEELGGIFPILDGSVLVLKDTFYDRVKGVSLDGEGESGYLEL